MSDVRAWVFVAAVVMTFVGNVGYREGWFGLTATWTAAEAGGIGLLILVVVSAVVSS